MCEKRFFEYAEAFERAYASGDWSVLEEQEERAEQREPAVRALFQGTRAPLLSFG